jgi:GNAT superfamily N-acetyltransferase
VSESTAPAVRPLAAAAREAAVPLLLLAEPSERALRWSLRHLSDTVYGLEVDGTLVGAASVRWEGDPCEIVELAIAPDRQGQGLGRHFVHWLLDEARRRGKRALEVGTGNASIGNIAFYQRCGLRMERVRKDYFSYHAVPGVEHGIAVRDLLVFRAELGER